MKKILVGMLLGLMPTVQAMKYTLTSNIENKFNNFEQLPEPLKAAILMQRILGDLQARSQDIVNPWLAVRRGKKVSDILSSYMSIKEFNKLLNDPTNARKLVAALTDLLGEDYILQLIPTASVGLIKVLLKGGLDVNTPFRQADIGVSSKWPEAERVITHYPLTEAVKSNRPDLVELFLKNGADAKVQTSLCGGRAFNLKTALELASDKGYLEIIKIFLDQGKGLSVQEREAAQGVLKEAEKMFISKRAQEKTRAHSSSNLGQTHQPMYRSFGRTSLSPVPQTLSAPLALSAQFSNYFPNTNMKPKSIAELSPKAQQLLQQLSNSLKVSHKEKALEVFLEHGFTNPLLLIEEDFLRQLDQPQKQLLEKFITEYSVHV